MNDGHRPHSHAAPSTETHTDVSAPPPQDQPSSWVSEAFESLRSFLSKKREEEAIMEAVEEIIEEPQESDGTAGAGKELLTNLLSARDKRASDIMIPRADIFAAEEGADLKKLAAMMSSSGHSRVPIFRRTLDDIIGFAHIKDVTAALVNDTPLQIKDILRKLLFVPPGMSVPKLLLQMREKRQHMALVVDEFGGIDGLVTIEDVVEVIVGEIDDEHDDPDKVVPLQRRADGSIIIDARLPIDTFEEQMGPVLLEHERQDNDTLGGLVFSLAGRVPVKGEILRHSSGMRFEVLDADSRRIKKLRVHNIPSQPSSPQRETA